MTRALLQNDVVIDVSPQQYASGLPNTQWFDATSQPDVQVGWVKVGNALQPRPQPQSTRQLAKLVIVDRATNQELAILSAMRSSSDPVQLRFAMRWDAAVVIEPEDPATAAAFASIFGQTRADELLA